MIKSKSTGHDIYWDIVTKIWRFLDTKIIKNDSRPCKKCKRHTVLVKLCKPRKYSRRTEVPVDRCIAPLVKLLNEHGVETVGACCGHDNNNGEILIVQDNKQIILKVKKKQ